MQHLLANLPVSQALFTQSNQAISDMQLAEPTCVAIHHAVLPTDPFCLCA